MKLRLKRLNGLYLITDHQHQHDKKLFQDVETALSAGVQILQYRDKSGNRQKQLHQCRQLRELTAEYDCVFIINDDPELALSCDADGVHLGKTDGAYEHARKLLGPEKIIGSSCYNQLERALHFQQIGADYVAFGRFFPSKTKPDAIQAEPALLSNARQQLQIPIVAIGGISHDNAQPLLDAGADMLAVINGVFGQADIRQATVKFQNLLTSEG